MTCYFLPLIVNVFGHYCHDAKTNTLHIDATVTGKCVIVQQYSLNMLSQDVVAEVLAEKITACLSQIKTPQNNLVASTEK